MSAACSFGVGAIFYGPDVVRGWIASLGSIRWWWPIINASLEGWLARVFTPVKSESTTLPAIVAPLTAIGSAMLIAVAIWRTRGREMDDAWTPLMTTALLASPLGWVYYVWWILPGTKPTRLLFRAPLLWIPVEVLPTTIATRFAATTIISLYFWGLVLVWTTALRSPRRRADTAIATP